MDNRQHAQLLEELSQRFVWFAQHDCRKASPLYEHLSLQIARDPEILELATFARKGQPVPNLLLGAVQFLLLRGVQHRLAAFFSSGAASSNEPTSYELRCPLRGRKLLQL